MSQSHAIHWAPSFSKVFLPQLGLVYVYQPTQHTKMEHISHISLFELVVKENENSMNLFDDINITYLCLS